MTVDEQGRHLLFLKLEKVLGPAEAAILMEHLPPVGWADVATKRDLDRLAAVTKRDLDQLAVINKGEHEQLRADFKREHEQLRADFKREHEQLRADFKREHEQLRTDFKREHEQLRADFKGDLTELERRNHIEHERLESAITAAFRGELIAQTRTMIFAMVSAVLAVASLGVAGRLL